MRYETYNLKKGRGLHLLWMAQEQVLFVMIAETTIPLLIIWLALVRIHQ